MALDGLKRAGAMLAAGGPKGAYLEALRTRRPRLIETDPSYFAAHDIDAVAFPMGRCRRRRFGEDETVSPNRRSVPTFTATVRDAGPGSKAGIPGNSLPVWLTDGGMPVGPERLSPPSARWQAAKHLPFPVVLDAHAPAIGPETSFATLRKRQTVTLAKTLFRTLCCQTG